MAVGGKVEIRPMMYSALSFTTASWSGKGGGLLPSAS